MNEYASIATIIAFVFAVIFIIFQTYTQKYGAPWVPTPYKTIRKMLKLAGVKPGDLVYDLGSGDGKIAMIASLFTKAAGIEFDEELVKVSNQMKKKLNLDVKFIQGDFMQSDISKYDVIFINPDKEFAAGLDAY